MREETPMFSSITRFFWDDKCPVCSTSIPITLDKKTAKCDQCGAEVELDPVKIRVRDIVVFVIVTFCADFVPTWSLKIGVGGVLLALWLYKSFKWQLRNM